jgi:hypothetical protein
MLLSLLSLLLVSAPDTLRVYNSHGHPMAVFATIGDKSVDLGVVAAGDTGKFPITIPSDVKQLFLRAYPPGDALSQITFTLEVKPEKPLFWSFEDS